MERQECQGRLRAVRGDLTDLAGEQKLTYMLPWRSIWMLSGVSEAAGVEEGDGLDPGGKGARRDEGTGNGQWDKKSLRITPP